MRTPETEESVFIAPDNTAQIVLTFDDNRLASTLFGQYGQNLALIERRLGVVANSRGNQVTVEGAREACDQTRRVLESLYERLKRGDDLVSGDVEGTIRRALSQGSLFDFDPAAARQSFGEINLRKRRVGARTAAQDAYVRASNGTRWCFRPGPPAPARPGSRSPMPYNYLSAKKSIASSCRARPWKRANGSAFYPATCAKRS